MVNYEAEIKLVFLPFLWNLSHLQVESMTRITVISFPDSMPFTEFLCSFSFLPLWALFLSLHLFLSSWIHPSFLSFFGLWRLTCWELLSKIWFPLMIQKLLLFPNLLSFNWVQFDLTLDWQRREKVDERKERKMERMKCFLFLTSFLLFDILKCFSRISSWKMVRFLGSVRMVSYTEKYLSFC